MSTKIAMPRIGYRDAVARQPESLEEVRRSVTKALDCLDLGGFRGKAIGFAGIGASYQAALAGAVFLRARGDTGLCLLLDGSLRRARFRGGCFRRLVGIGPEPRDRRGDAIAAQAAAPRDLPG